MPICTMCHNEKDESEFRFVNRKVRPYRMTECKECDRARKALLRMQPQTKERQSEYRQRPDVKAKNAAYQREYQKRLRELAAIGKQVLEQQIFPPKNST